MPTIPPVAKPARAVSARQRIAPPDLSAARASGSTKSRENHSKNASREGKSPSDGTNSQDSSDKSAREPSDDTRPGCYSCAASELGHVRKINEDAFLDAREQALWVVADGMGGHSRGDRASQAIIEALQSFESKDSALESVNELLSRLHSANDLCREVAAGQVMGSTVAVLHVNDGSAYVLWAGDSRIYRLRDGDFAQLTDDHSLVQELHRLGELTADEAENHPSSNVITRAIGVADDVDVQVRKLDLQAGDRFLLCSDGLFKDVRQNEIKTNLSLPSPRQALDELVRLALRRGGTDNVTAIVVQMAIV